MLGIVGSMSVQGDGVEGSWSPRSSHGHWSASSLSLVQKWQLIMMARVIPCQGTICHSWALPGLVTRQHFALLGCGGLSRVMDMTKPDSEPCLSLN